MACPWRGFPGGDRVASPNATISRSLLLSWVVLPTPHPSPERRSLISTGGLQPSAGGTAGGSPQFCVQNPLTYGALSLPSTAQSQCHQSVVSLERKISLLSWVGRNLQGHGEGGCNCLHAFTLLLPFPAALLLSEGSGSSPSRVSPGIEADPACSLLPPYPWAFRFLLSLLC